MPTLADIEYLQFHWDDDPVKLLFAAHSHPEIDMAWVAQQLEGRRQAATKWPDLALEPHVWYPPKINREQASSTALARYKSEQLDLQPNTRMADLTGGMGIDSLHFAQRAAEVHYVELDSLLCDTASHNFKVLNATNVTTHCDNCLAWIERQGHFDLIYIDPARRDANGKKVAAFEECQPDLLGNLQLLRSHCDRLVVKASPMISIPTALDQLKEVSRLHIVALKGECKEVLFELASTPLQEVVCANLESQQPTLSFDPQEEAAAEHSLRFATRAQRYLYEPNAAIMKSGFYKSMATRYHLEKLARNTHLYTSDTLVEEFPGRIFETLQEVKLNAKELARLLPDRKAHVISRNHPDPAPTLQQRLKIKEGGDLFVVATTLGEKPTTFLSQRIK